MTQVPGMVYCRLITHPGRSCLDYKLARMSLRAPMHCTQVLPRRSCIGIYARPVRAHEHHLCCHLHSHASQSTVRGSKARKGWVATCRSSCSRCMGQQHRELDMTLMQSASCLRLPILHRSHVICILIPCIHEIDASHCYPVRPWNCSNTRISGFLNGESTLT